VTNIADAMASRIGPVTALAIVQEIALVIVQEIVPVIVQAIVLRGSATAAQIHVMSVAVVEMRTSAVM
jgi:hypothetical protein